MFLNFTNKTVLNPQVAPYLKAPIVTDSLDIPNTKCNPYNNIYYMMNIAEKHGNRTYFYRKANALNYHSTSQNEIAVFVTDYINDIYNPINLNKTKISIKSERNIVIGVDNKNWYLIAEEADLENEKNFLIISLNDGKILYKKNRSDKDIIYFAYYYPIYDVIIPILIVTKYGISVEMYNILSEQVYNIKLIDLESLRNIADTTIKREGKNVDTKGEDIEAIQYAKVEEPRYRICMNESNLMCFNSIYVLLSLELKIPKTYTIDYKEKTYLYIFEHLQIIIGIDSNKLYCKFDLSRAHFRIAKAHYDKIQGRPVEDQWDSTILAFFYDKSRDIMLPYAVRHEYPYEIPKDTGRIYLSIYMYGNDCYKIINNEHGVNIVTQNEELIPSLRKISAIYHHKNYLFVLRTDLLGQIDLIIIETKHKLISITEEDIKISFTGDGGKTLHKNMLNFILWFFYYLKKHNSFIFISNDHQYLLLVKADEIEKVLRDISRIECGENSSADGLVKVYNILELILEAIESYMERIYKKISFYMIEHHIDVKSDKLYLLVKYIVGKKKYICLLEMEIIDNELNFKILYMHNEKITYSNIEKIGIKNSYINNKFMNKLSILGHNNTFIKDLDILYTNNGAFVSIKYNRKSPRIDELIKSYYGHTNEYITCGLASQYHYGNLIIFKYECKHKKRIYRNQFQTIEDYNDYNLILVDFAVVLKMNVTNTET